MTLILDAGALMAYEHGDPPALGWTHGFRQAFREGSDEGGRDR